MHTEKPVAPKPAAPSTTHGGTVIVHGRWGGAPGEFGRRRDPESAPEGPMALAIGSGGEVAIVDQVNRRIERFRDGRLVGTLAIGGDTVQDLALAPGGRTALLDRLADRDVQLWDDGGKLLNEAPLVGKGLPEGGAATGVFADGDGIFVEREHGALVRVADASGNVDRDRAELPGRPMPDGRLLVRAAIADRAAGAVRVEAFDRRTLAPAWQRTVEAGAPILHLLLLDGDARGEVFVGADVGRESSEPPYPIVDESIVVLRLAPDGASTGRLALPPLGDADESFRPLAVGPDGAIYEMLASPDGLSVVRYTIP